MKKNTSSSVEMKATAIEANAVVERVAGKATSGQESYRAVVGLAGPIFCTSRCERVYMT